MNRTDHPTAETIYENLRREYPKISLGTVYRNLSLLSELGEIQTIATGVGPDRFDGNAKPHYHFICKHCGAVIDLKLQGLEHINLLAQHGFTGDIEDHTVFFYGTCEACKKGVDSQSET
jgi:Fur family peroxide stress response transcriptional regulator